MRRIMDYQLEMILNDDLSRLTFINVEKAKLDEINQSLSSEKNFLDTNAGIEAVLGRSIDINTCSVAQYKAYEKFVEEKIMAIRSAS